MFRPWVHAVRGLGKQAQTVSSLFDFLRDALFQSGILASDGWRCLWSHHMVHSSKISDTCVLFDQQMGQTYLIALRSINFNFLTQLWPLSLDLNFDDLELRGLWLNLHWSFG